MHGNRVHTESLLLDIWKNKLVGLPDTCHQSAAAAISTKHSLSLSPSPYKPTNHHKFPQSRERREQCLFALATRRGQDFSQIQKAELILLSSSLPDFPFKTLFSSPIYLPPPLVLLDILDSRLIDCVEWVSRNHCLGRYWREMAPKSGKGKSGKTSNRAEKKKKEEKGMSAPC